MESAVHAWQNLSWFDGFMFSVCLCFLYLLSCCKFVVVELPSPVTAIEPAVDVPVSVFVLRVAIVYPMTVWLERLHYRNQT